MPIIQKYWWHLVVLVAAMIVLAFGRFDSFTLPSDIQMYCQQGTQAHERYCPAYEIFLAFLAGLKTYEAAITAIATALIAYFTYTLKNSTDNLWIATNQNFIAEHRPWISIEAELISLRFIKRAATIDLKFTLKNTGNAPAANVYASAEYFLLTGAQNLAADRRKFRETTRIQAGAMGGFVIFPGEIVTCSQFLVVPPSNIDKGQFFGRDRDHFFAPFIYACVDYRFMFKEESHQTTAGFTIGNVPIPVNDGRIEGLEIDRMPFGDEAN